jgi:asparagine synthetase B (glutamine-hydrolysing)
MPEVRRLPPGHYLDFLQERVRLTRFWNPERIRTDRKMDYDRMLSDLRVLLEDAVAIRCDGRFTAGAHVSSGIDSAIVAALVRRNYNSQPSFYGYSWSPAGFSAGEIPYDERTRKMPVHCNGDLPGFFRYYEGAFTKALAGSFKRRYLYRGVS